MVLLINSGPYRSSFIDLSVFFLLSHFYSLILLASQLLHLLVCGKDHMHKPIRGLEALCSYKLEN